jgi:hypothetical protein
MSTNTIDSDDDEQSSDESDDEVTEVTIRRDSSGWTVVETSDNVESSVHYVISLGRHRRITLKTEVGPPESDTEDD